MASKKYIELQDFSDEELGNEIAETKKQLKKVRFDHAVKGLDNPLVIREIRRDIARLNSEEKRREIKSMAPEELKKRTKIRSRRKNN